MSGTEQKRCFQCGATYSNEELSCQLDDTPLAADTIGRRWRVEGFLSKRPGGGVFAAFHLVSGVRGAVDLVPWPLTEDHALGGRLYREVQALRLLDKHPNVPRLLETGTDRDGSRFVVTGLDGRRSLREWMDEWHRPRGGLLPPARATQLLAPVLSALAMAHRIGICHGKLSAASIFIGAGAGGADAETVMLHGLALGAPAAAQPGAQTPPSSEVRHDLMAVARLFVDLVAERQPRRSEDGPLAWRATQDDQRILGPRLIRVLERALSREGAPEYPSAEDLMQALLLVAPPPVPVHAAGHRVSMLMPVHRDPAFATQQNPVLPLPLSPLDATLPRAGLTGELRQVSVLDLFREEETQPQREETLAVSRMRPFSTRELAASDAIPGAEEPADATPGPPHEGTGPPAAEQEASYPVIEVVGREPRRLPDPVATPLGPGTCELAQGAPTPSAGPAHASLEDSQITPVRAATSLATPPGLLAQPMGASSSRPEDRMRPPRAPVQHEPWSQRPPVGTPGVPAAGASVPRQRPYPVPALPARTPLRIPSSPLFWGLLGVITASFISAIILGVVKKLRRSRAAAAPLSLRQTEVRAPATLPPADPRFRYGEPAR